MNDTITLIRAVSGARLTKRWNADGTIEGYEDAKTFTHLAKQAGDLKVLSEVLENIRAKPSICAIRGAYPPGAPTRVLRNTESTNDAPHHWCMIDVDDYEPLVADPVHDPAAAAAEFISDKLPPEFQGASFYYQLSSSAGAPGKEHLLKAHLWFWLAEPADSTALRTWAKTCPGVDPSVFRQVQPHYTADPVGGPAVQRSGLVEGALGDDVPVSFLANISLVSSQGDTDGGDIDIGKIKSPVTGYDIDRVRDEVLAHLDPNMPHDDWVLVGMALHHQFDGAGEALDLWDEWSSDGVTWQEGVCAQRWPTFRVDRSAGTGSATLGSLLKQARPAAAAVAQIAQPGAGRADTVLAALALKMGQKDVSWFEASISWRATEFEDTLARMAWDPNRSRFFICPRTGGYVFSSEKDLGMVLRKRNMLEYCDREALEQLITAAAQPAANAGSAQIVGQPPWTAAQVKEFKAECSGWFLKYLRETVVAHRQYGATRESVDLFAKQAYLSLHDRELTLALVHEPLPEGPIDQGLIADYKRHFPQLDDYLALLVAARMANDRKRAYLWLHAVSNWGKGFLTGMLKDLGLVVITTMDELANAVAGAPSGLTPEIMVRAWLLVVDEVKGVPREIKNLTSEISFSPKNRLKVTVPVFTKQLMSAEDIPSLVSDSSGADAQFINRFMRIEGVGELDARPLYQRNNGAYAATVRNYIASVINRRVEESRAVGRAAAAAQGDRELERLHKRFPLLCGEQRPMDELLQDLVERFMDDMRAGSSDRSTTVGRVAHDHASEHNGRVYLQRGELALEQWLKANFPAAEAGRWMHKKSALVGLLPKNMTHKVEPGQDGKRIKARLLGEESGARSSADEAFL